MVPIVQLIKEHIGLVRKLRRFSFPHTGQFVAGLSLCPELHANTIRIEVLQHLVAISCVGKAKPSRDDLADWLRKQMAESFTARMEDPVEDVFVGCVNSEFGSFRIFAGVFSDGDFWIERLLAFLAEKQNFPPFEMVLQTVLALVKISDALAERTDLARYSASGCFVSDKAQIPPWRKVLSCAKAVHFSVTDLVALGVDLKMLQEFVFNESRKPQLEGEELWNSSFERHPLILVEDGVIVTAPSQIQSAVLRYLIEHVTKSLGGWADMFFQSETASLFVNEVRRRLEIEPMNFKPPPWPDGVQPMSPFFGQFDFGKPVIMLTHCTPLSKSAAVYNGFESFSDDGKLRDYLRACASEFETIPGFSGGLILICMASVGYNITVGINQDLPNWHIDVATLPDWLTLTALGDCPAMRLWKLGEHEAVLHNYNVKTLNLSGLVNQYAFWKANGFRLVPKDSDPRTLSLMTINSDFATGFRIDVKKRRDIHCVRSHDGQRWIKLTRHNSRPLFKEDGEIPLYTDINSAANGCLAGCVKRTRTNWWIISPPRQENSELTGIVFRLWECIEAWTARVAAVIERDWPNFSVPSIEVQLNLPNLAKWEYGQKKNSFSKLEELLVSADAGQMRIVLTIPEGFLPAFSTPKNLAEAEIVAALLKGAVQLAGGQLGNQKSTELVREIMRNEDARYFHMVQARGVEQMVTTGGQPKPLFIREEDSSLVQQGVADLVGRPQSGKKIVGLDDCKTYLKETVTRVWERIETRLKPFNREFVVLRCFQALDEIARDEKQWDMTARSQFALHKDQENVHDVLLDRRSDRAKASLCNRLIIETAQYACPLTDGRMFTEADHLTILADMALLILLANHRDAIAYGFMKAEIAVLPNGELEVDEKFYANVLSQYLTKRGRVASDEAVADYESYFPWIEQSRGKTTVGDENILNEFDNVFAPEFGFSIHLLFRALDEFRTMAVKTDEPGGKVTEDVMQLFLRVSGFKTHEAEAFLNRFTLPIRSAWDRDLLPRCRDYDVFPWRFRRQLSLNVRPLVQVGLSPRTWVVSVPVFEKSVTYVLGHLEHARFPQDFFHSTEMQKYVGDVTNKRGHDFAEKVGKVFVESGYITKLEIEVTQLGASKKLRLGDVDVLSWEENSGRVYAVECKRLLAASSVREVVQRLEDFRGDKREKDSLGRHLRRIEWLKKNPEALAKFTGIPTARIRLMPLLVTSEIVPMQFYKDMKFPTSQVLSFDELAAAIRKD